MRVEYQEVPLEEVISYYSDDFEPVGVLIDSCEYFLDIQKGVVVFKLYTEDAKDEG